MLRHDARCGLMRRLQPVRIGVADLVLVALQQLVGLVGAAHAVAPGRDDMVVGQAEVDVGIAASRPRSAGFRASSRSHSGVLGSACRRLMVSSGICDGSMNSSRCWPVSGLSVSRPRMMPDTTSMPKPFSVLDRFHDRHHHVVILVHRLQRHRIRRLDAAEDRREVRLAHQREDFRPLGDVERRLAGKAQHDSRCASAIRSGAAAARARPCGCR